MAQTVSEPTAPADPLELVAGDAQPVSDVSQRALVINLLINARRNSNVRAYPYYLKTRFTAFGSSSSDGSWQLEDMAQSGLGYRWTAQGPSYSAINVYSNGVLYSNQPSTSVPLRLAQVRAAIFFVQPMLGPRASLRTAAANLNGVELTCALVSHGELAKNTTGGRRWAEEEYCIDAHSGNLITHSPAPGLYVLYDYSKALHFHEKTIANNFTITQGGRIVIEAQTDSVADATENAAAFQPTGLNTIGVGSIMTAPWQFRMRAPASTAVTNGSMQLVVVHGMQAPDGHLSEVELISSTNASLDSAALDYARSWQFGVRGEDVEAGATPQSHELILTLQFGGVPVQQ